VDFFEGRPLDYGLIDCRAIRGGPGIDAAQIRRGMCKCGVCAIDTHARSLTRKVCHGGRRPVRGRRRICAKCRGRRFDRRRGPRFRTATPDAATCSRPHRLRKKRIGVNAPLRWNAREQDVIGVARVRSSPKPTTDDSDKSFDKKELLGYEAGLDSLRGPRSGVRQVFVPQSH
jgi:hypothetical protein